VLTPLLMMEKTGTLAGLLEEDTGIVEAVLVATRQSLVACPLLE